MQSARVHPCVDSCHWRQSGRGRFCTGFIYFDVYYYLFLLFAPVVDSNMKFVYVTIFLLKLLNGKFKNRFNCNNRFNLFWISWFLCLMKFNGSLLLSSLTDGPGDTSIEIPPFGAGKGDFSHKLFQSCNILIAFQS